MSRFDRSNLELRVVRSGGNASLSFYVSFRMGFLYEVKKAPECSFIDDSVILLTRGEQFSNAV